jgi:hypothetical protein
MADQTHCRAYFRPVAPHHGRPRRAPARNLLGAGHAIRALAVLCLLSGSALAQEVVSGSGPANGLSEFFSDPLSLAALVLTLTLLIGLALDAVRGRFSRSHEDAPTASTPDPFAIEQNDADESTSF